MSEGECTPIEVEEMLRRSWPWAEAFSRHLHNMRPTPFEGSHLLFGSDYSGSHAGSQFFSYGFVIADADASPKWPQRCHHVRAKFLADRRRMSFKNLNDIYRRNALIPFLEAAEALDGNVVVVAVHKDLANLSTHKGSKDVWKSVHRVHARWDARAFEQMARVALFFSLF